ncbi:hypothetical protein [Aneurinibacillus thermoaerophilus]|uniref:hypothetical protein n=1 Tax=Aneurinibacillus thermoaerophilus TaxID=143495 RepID=UPI002E20216D|nr:hypothetical protein [Aneurinibacillus thermoaerophilus]
MSKEQILQTILNSIGDSVWVLTTLYKQNKGVGKEQLRGLVNERYGAKHEGKILITSRHILDRYLSRLEGAGLVDVSEHGRARHYHLSELGHELINFRKNIFIERKKPYGK